jgi:alpha 1,2-mannosyltransferase
VHSIAASLFARKDQVHFFKDIGYRHSSLQHCPQGKDWSKGRCACDPSDSFGTLIIRGKVLGTEVGTDYHADSCLRRYENLF